MLGPQLKSLSLDSGGKPITFRVLLPPHFGAGKRSIPTKIEADIGGERLPLEGLSQTEAYWLDPPYLLVALLLESWCEGKLSSILMLTPDQLRQLLQPLEGQSAVFSIREPEKAIPWEGGKLVGVHDTLVEEPPARVLKSNPEKRTAPTPSVIADLKPMEVDGSTHYLAITLPSRESSCYQEALELVKRNGFRLEPSNRKWWLRDRHQTLQFLSNHWDKLETHYRARFSKNFIARTARISRAGIRFQAKENNNGFEVDLNLDFPGIPPQRFSEAIAKNQAYLDDNGKIVLIEPSALNRFADATHKLSGEARAIPTPQFRQQLTHAELAAASEALEPLNLAEQPPEAWQRRSAALHDLTALKPVLVPHELNQRLRPYQRIGASWLWHLYRHGLGGILADEMGLGKTIQALTLLVSIHHTTEAKEPSLIICPAALVENWYREAQTFTPWLKPFIHHGAKRLEYPEEASTYDLIITSYGTLARDSSLFEQITFASAVGDEAQHVKNRQTRNAKALRALNVKRRFLLTGTPVENSLDDLAALFAFILPGYLKKSLPNLSREEREWQNKQLRDRVAPYILRRSKKSVAPELPDKIQQTIYCELGPEQRAFYRNVEQAARREVFELEMANASEGRLHMAAFKELLRLRQACIDPRLIEAEGELPPSAKLIAFRELLQEAIDGGHRILVFSQFTTALALLQDELKAQGLAFLYLDGKTKNRPALCQRFNEDESIPVFLISLKAGGVGLNLTGADTVVHYDPWWNPAVEAQATDRAHRIGQTRVVTSYQLICAQTVEERVLALQRSKSVLLREVFEASASTHAQLKLEDLKSLLGGAE